MDDAPGNERHDEEWEPFFQTVESHIEEVGYHLTYVGDEPPFCYSVGLSRTWSHPELLLYGLNYEDSGTILAGLAEEVRRGRRFHHGYLDVEAFDRPVAFLEIPPDEYFGRFVVTLEFYSGAFDALQVVTPDAAGRFPWSGDCEAATVESQPLLGRPPN